MTSAAMVGVRLIQASFILKKEELTRIRKVARVLRDPGTTSSWRSPLPSSSRSVASPPTSVSHLNSNVSGAADNNFNKTKKVFLYNWKGSSKSSRNGDYEDDDDYDDVMDNEEEEGYGVEEDEDQASSVAALTVDDSLSHGGDFRSEAGSLMMLQRMYPNLLLLPPKRSKKTVPHSRVDRKQSRDLEIGEEMRGQRKK